MTYPEDSPLFAGLPQLRDDDPDSDLYDLAQALQVLGSGGPATPSATSDAVTEVATVPVTSMAARVGKTPSWMRDPAQIDVVERIWAFHTRGTPRSTIATTMGISVEAVQKGIERGHWLSAQYMRHNHLQLTANAVAHREQIIAEAYRELERLVGNNPSQNNTGIRSDPRRSRAAAALLTVISHERAQIETILGLRGRIRDVSTPANGGGEGDSPAAVNVTIDIKTALVAQAAG